MNENHKTIGIILTYNCAPMLESTWQRIPKELFDEIILVDDGSQDNTMEVARNLGITSLTHPHSGYGGNIKFGLEEAIKRGADYMIEIHGDGQYSPSFIPAALEKIKRENLAFLLGSRFTNLKNPLKDKMPLSRYLANIGLSFMDRLVLRVPLTEFHTGFRVYTKNLIQTVGLTGTSDDYLFSFEIIAMARFHNLPIGEIPIRCDYSGEHTSISIWKSTVYSFQMLKVLFDYLLACLGFKSCIFRR